MAYNWVQHTPATQPTVQESTFSCYMPGVGAVYPLGITNNSFPFTFDTKTWIWDGTDWTSITTADRPSNRTNYRLAYHAGSDRVIMFGGSDEITGATDETWAFDGTNWTQLAPASSPPPRYGHGMARDVASGKIVMFGGLDNTYGGGLFDDTWAFDGTTWTEESPAHVPTARRFPMVSQDLNNENVVMFGGSSYPGAVWYADTWIWDGADWTDVSPVGSPSAREAAGIDSISALGVIMFGGFNGSAGPVLFDETWRWDGAAWAQQSPVDSPAEADFHSLVGMQSNATFLSFAGGVPPDVETWIYEPPAYAAISHTFGLQ